MPPSLTSQRDQAVLRALARRLEPGDAGAHNNLGVLYFNKGLLDDAATMFTRALALQPRLRVALRNLEILHAHPDYAERRMRELRDEVEASPTSREPRFALARALALAGRHDDAIGEYAELLSQDATDVEAMVQAGLTVRAVGDLADAQRWLEHAERLDPDRAEVHLHLGEVLYNRGLADAALERLERAVELDPDDADAYHLLGFVLGDLGRHDDARAATTRALALNPAMARSEANLSLEPTTTLRAQARRSPEGSRGGRSNLPACDGSHLAHFNLGLAFRHKGYLAEAGREYLLALDRGEERGLVLQALAEVRLLQHDTAAAIAIYDELLAEAPQSPKLWNERGVALHQAGRVDEARASYETAVAADAGYALALNNLGVALFHLRQAPAAEAAFVAALREEPSFVKALLNQALLLGRDGRLDEAREYYRRALTVDPEQPVAWNGLGRVFLDQRHFADARPAFARAIQARPEYAEAHYNLGFVLSNLGDFDGALRATRRALELDPYYVSQRFELAIDLEYESPDLSVLPELEQEQRGDAPVDSFSFDAGALQSLLGSLAPRSGALPTIGSTQRPAGEECAELLARAGEFARQGLYGEALERFDQARMLVPDHREAAIGAVRAMLALGRATDARTRLTPLLALDSDDPELLVLDADASLAAGDAVWALHRATEAAELIPDRADAWQRLGDASSRLGHPSAAADAYGRALALEPDRAAVRRSFATLLAAAGRHAEAEVQLRAALDTVPSYGAAALDLALLLRQTGRSDQARQVLIAALRHDAHDLEALAELADLLLENGAAADAQVAVQRVLRDDDEHAGGLYVQGLLHARQHRMRDAVACWHQAIASDVTGAVAERARRAAARAGDVIPLGLVA